MSYIYIVLIGLLVFSCGNAEKVNNTKLVEQNIIQKCPIYINARIYSYNIYSDLYINKSNFDFSEKGGFVPKIDVDAFLLKYLPDSFDSNNVTKHKSQIRRNRILINKVLSTQVDSMNRGAIFDNLLMYTSLPIDSEKVSLFNHYLQSCKNILPANSESYSNGDLRTAILLAGEGCSDTIWVTKSGLFLFQKSCWYHQDLLNTINELLPGNLAGGKYIVNSTKSP